MSTLMIAAVAVLAATVAFGQDAYRYEFELPASDAGYHVAVKGYLDDLDPNVAPSEENLGERDLATFATPGEYEPLTFVIYATADLSGVEVVVSDLVCEEETIPAEAVRIRTVVRAPQKRAYFSPPEEAEVMSRFLVAAEPLDLASGQFREVWLTIQVPDEAAAGEYAGSVSVSSEGRLATTLPLSLEVLPFRLQEPTGKRFGLYYRMDKVMADNPERLAADLADMREHGITIIVPHLGPELTRLADGQIAVDYSGLEDGLTMLRDAGFEMVMVQTRLPRLQRLLEVADEAITTDESFGALAGEVVEGIVSRAGDFPGMAVVLTHMDEVFNRDRLPRYIALTQVARRTPGLRHYITFHTLREEAEEQRRQVDPYVDIRGHHGYTFEWWLARGRTIDDYEQELADSGDQATFYLNPTRIWRTTRWQRIVNGLYMWISPFSARLDWTAQPSPHDSFGDPIQADNAYVFMAADGVTPIATRLWEGWREGIDDLRYLATLERAIAEQGDAHLAEAEQARAWLAELRESLPAPQGLEANTGPGPQRDEQESPFIHAIAQEFSSEDLQQMRREAAEHIAALTE